MLEELEALAGTGLGALRIEARREGPEYVGTVVKAYGDVVEMLTNYRRGKDLDLTPTCADLARFSPAGFTRGHYFRGVVP